MMTTTTMTKRRIRRDDRMSARNEEKRASSCSLDGATDRLAAGNDAATRNKVLMQPRGSV